MHFQYLPFSTAKQVVLFLIYYYLYVRSESLYGPMIWRATMNFCASQTSVKGALNDYVDGDELRLWGVFLLLGVVNGFWLAELARRRRAPISAV
jgi:hypothetical protein